MSTVKVNKITPRTCNSIQLGESGDTLTIPSGATLQNCGTATGFGLSFCTTVKTSPFTATANKGFLINTGSEVTVTLPASPSTGDELIVIDSTGNASSNNITLGRNGSKIKGQCIDAKINVDRGGVRIVYSGSSQGWVTATAANDATASQIQYVTATGGTVTTCGDFKIHTFTASGCFQVTCAGNPSGSTTADYLVVAGGGGGASGPGGAGGGGAGGHRFSFPNPATGGFPVSVQTYPITVGAGGSGGPNPSPTSLNGASGSNTVFSTITSSGGGGGLEAGPVPSFGNGGSGGGGSYQTGCGGAGNTPPVSPSQGNNGGTGALIGSGNTSGGGGGGAGAVGGPGPTGTSSRAGAGGAGVANSITGSPVTRASGGNGHGQSGGGNTTNPTPTPGGGGASGANGTANTGGGGGSNGPGGGAGGSGIVVIRYKFQN
jgi:hypothetical protein